MRSPWLRWLPLLVWMAVIFLISANPDPYATAAKDLGSQTTRVFSLFSNETLGQASHLAEYIVLGLLAAWAVLPNRSARQIVAMALSICLLYALSDEIHQIFVPGRAFQLADLLLDLIGCTIGIWISVRVGRHEPGGTAR